MLSPNQIWDQGAWPMQREDRRVRAIAAQLFRCTAFQALPLSCSADPSALQLPLKVNILWFLRCCSGGCFSPSERGRSRHAEWEEESRTLGRRISGAGLQQSTAVGLAQCVASATADDVSANDS